MSDGGPEVPLPGREVPSGEPLPAGDFSDSTVGFEPLDLDLPGDDEEAGHQEDEAREVKVVIGVDGAPLVIGDLAADMGILADLLEQLDLKSAARTGDLAMVRIIVDVRRGAEAINQFLERHEGGG